MAMAAIWRRCSAGVVAPSEGDALKPGVCASLPGRRGCEGVFVSVIVEKCWRLWLVVAGKIQQAVDAVDFVVDFAFKCFALLKGGAATGAEVFFLKVAHERYALKKLSAGHNG